MNVSCMPMHAYSGKITKFLSCFHTRVNLTVHHQPNACVVAFPEKIQAMKVASVGKEH